MDPLRSDAALEAVVARQREGEPDSAAALGRESLLLFPDLTTLLLATSDAELARGNALAALTLRRRAAYLRPGVWQYQQVTAAAAARAGLCDEARRRACAAARLAPVERAPRLFLDSLDRGLVCRPRP
jgi:Flp pilus assembly protein TadD